MTSEQQIHSLEQRIVGLETQNKFNTEAIQSLTRQVGTLIKIVEELKRAI